MTRVSAHVSGRQPFIETSFGSLFYGNRPTNTQGKAEFLCRTGVRTLSVEGTFNGGDKYAPAHGVTLVDFGPALNRFAFRGSAHYPYPTAGIALPFLFFYGTMWIVFFYVGYLIIWRLPQIRKQQAKSS